MNRDLPGLTAKTIGSPAFYLETAGSTNSWIKERGHSLPHGSVCWTGRQTAGRGRFGRRWESGDGESLAMSLLIKPSAPPALPQVCGIAVSEALYCRTGGQFYIKWPNDVLCEGRKVCGILCESFFIADQSFSIAGIGINIGQSAGFFGQAGLHHAGSLKMLCPAVPDMPVIAAEIINRLEPLLLRFLKDGFPPLKSTYEARCVNLGKEVAVLSSSGQVIRRGLATGIADDGSLMVDSGGGAVPVSFGEVSVRGIDGYI